MIETDGNKGRGALSRMAAQVRAHPFAAATTGFACAYTVAIVFFYYDWLFELPGTDPFLYELALNGSLCVTAAVMFAVSRKRVVPRVGAAVSGGVLYAAALACVGLAFSAEKAGAALESPAPFAYAAAAAAGCGAGVLVPLWFGQAGLLAHDKCAYVLGLGSLAGAPAALGIDLLPAGPLVASCAVLLAASMALLLVLGGRRRTAAPGKAPQGVLAGAPSRPGSEKDHAGGKAPAFADGRHQDRPPHPALALAVPLVYVLLLSFSYGMLDYVAMASPAVTAADSGLASQAAGLFAIGAFLLNVRQGGKRYAALLNAALAAIATGLLFLPFLTGAYSVVMVTLAHVG